MDRQILLVTRNDDTAELLTERFKQLMPVLVDRAHTFDQAENRLEHGHYDLIVSEVGIAKNGSSSPSLNDKMGLNLLKKLRSQEKTVPVALIDSTEGRDTRKEVQRLAWADYVAQEGDEWDEDVMAVCNKLLSQEALREKDLRLNLDLVLHPANDYRFRLQIVGHPGNPDEGPLFIKDRVFDSLKLRSDKIYRDEKDRDTWEAELEDQGRELGEQIFESNGNFAKKFERCLGEVRSDKSKVSIRFIVEEAVHPILLEAIKEGNQDYWMLQAPIYRQLSVRANRYALFEDKATRLDPINCLIIEANIDDWVDPELNCRLKRLENVPKEVSWLENFLSSPDNKRQFHIGEVRKISDESAGGDFEKAVRDALQKEKWHIVHFAGHSFYEGRKKEGYIFLPGEKISRITAETFASWLDRSEARLVYLSSCHSSEQDFVFALAKNLVPAIVGFRWDIKDDLAREYTQCFYERLFETLSLDRAFLQARQKMHADHRQEPIWAAPMLVIQAKQDWAV